VSNPNNNQQPQPVQQPSPDLSYLHPDNLRIGSIGVFAGDWAWTGTPPRIPVGFVGVLIDYWNGWAVWRCTREVAEAVAADQDRERELERQRLAESGLTGDDLDRRVDEYLPPVYFDGDDLILDETAKYGEPGVDRQSPAPDGRYCPMGFNWTWQAVDPSWCDRIAGTLPAFGEHREYVMAVHQPLRMPHDRLTITAIDATTTGYGTTRTAALALDGEPVGTVQHGPGQPAQFRPADARFGDADLDAFVRACRWRGHEIDTATVLQALIAEYQTAQHIATAHDNGHRAVILRDGDDHIVGTDIVVGPDPIEPAYRQTLAGLLTDREAERRPHQNQFVWQIWTGRRWQLLGIVDVPREDSAAGPDTSGIPGSGETPPESGRTEPSGDGR
jgi:hypothetical protein